MSLIGKIYFTSDHIIKVSSETTNYVYGYDIDTEELVKANKKFLLPITQSMLKLTHSPKLQICLAEYILKRHQIKVTTDDIAESLKVSTRTLMRMMKEIDPITDNKKYHRSRSDKT